MKLVIEDDLLSIGFTGQNQNWANHERLNSISMVFFGSLSDPGAVLQKQGSSRSEVLGFVIFEVQVQSNDRPIAMISFPQCLLDDGSNAIEEIVLHRWLMAGDWISVSDDGPALPGLWIGVPGKILLDCNGGACCERSIDAVMPPLGVGIAIVRVHDGTCSGMCSSRHLLRIHRKHR